MKKNSTSKTAGKFKLHRETLGTLGLPELREVVGQNSRIDTCYSTGCTSVTHGN
jgi:hypothetical protein